MRTPAAIIPGGIALAAFGELEQVQRPLPSIRRNEPLQLFLPILHDDDLRRCMIVAPPL